MAAWLSAVCLPLRAVPDMTDARQTGVRGQERAAAKSETSHSKTCSRPRTGRGEVRDFALQDLVRGQERAAAKSETSHSKTWAA